MSNHRLINLDIIAAQTGFEMAKEVFHHSEKKRLNAKKSEAENLITKSLGVLQEQGLYAFFLYLEANRKGKNEERRKTISPCSVLSDKAFELLKSSKILSKVQSPDPLQAIRDDLAKRETPDDLIFAHSLLIQALIYARYHAKALPDSEPTQSEEGTK